MAGSAMGRPPGEPARNNKTRMKPRTKKSPRRFVRMFKPQFAALVKSGKKRQTVRPTPKGRMPVAGDTIEMRQWTGMPYRSKQRLLGESTIVHVERISIDRTALIKNGGNYFGLLICDEFARADGFKDFADMVQWFDETHGLPFQGIVIYW
jgi:hypothetical protein